MNFENIMSSNNYIIRNNKDLLKNDRIQSNNQIV